MKKLLSYLLAAVMVLSTGFSSVYAEDVPSTPTPALSQPLKLTPSTCGNGTHSGHQTRIVHTSHGDYAAYLSDEIYSKDGGNSYFNELSIVKIQDGKQKLLFQDYVSYDSSSISIFADKNENVYAATLVSNKWGSQYGANVAIWAVDTETDEVNGHIANIPFAKPAKGGYGYAQPVINDQTGKIYALFSGGDYPNAGVIAWFTFDLATQQWDSTCHYIDIDARHCYHHAFASGSGICLVTQRDVLATNYGYPEVTRGGGNTWWPADYVWDQEDLYMITDMTADNAFSSVPVAEADYSKLSKGSTSYTIEERQTRLYPANKVYDTYLDGSELHVVGDTRWYTGAYDRKNREGHIWHRVFDVSNPSNVKLLQDNELTVFEGYETSPKEGYFISNSYSPWLIRGADGTFYIAGMRSDNSLKETGETDSDGFVTTKVPNNVIGKLQLIQLDGNAQSGYTYTRAYVSDSLGDTDGGFSVASGRSHSAEDGTLAMIYTVGGKKDWFYVTMELPKVAPRPEEPDPEEKPDTEIEISTEINSKIPDDITTKTDLGASGYTGVEQVTNKLKNELQKNYASIEVIPEGADKNAAFFDATLKIKENGVERDVKLSDFNPQAGSKGFLEAKFLYEDIFKLLGWNEFDGCRNYTFTIVHMFSMNGNGHRAGQTEVFTVLNKDPDYRITRDQTGLTIRVTGLSPFAILVDKKYTPDYQEPTPNPNPGVVTPTPSRPWYSTIISSSSDEEEATPNRYSIRITKTAGGTVNPNRSIVTVLEGGNSQRFTIKPNEGYKIADVIIDGKSQGAISSYVFKNVTGDHTFKVNFAKLPVPEIDDDEGGNPNTGAC